MKTASFHHKTRKIGKVYSAFFIGLILSNLYTEPCHAMNKEDDELIDNKINLSMISETIIVIPENKKENENLSLAVKSVKGFLEKSSEELMLVQKNFNDAFSLQIACQEEDIEKVKKQRGEISDNINQARKKVLTSVKGLEMISQNLSTENKTFMSNTDDLDKWLSNRGFDAKSTMNQPAIKEKVHNLKKGHQTLNVPYSGTVNYNGEVEYKGNVYYSGSQYYSGSIDYPSWTCNYCTGSYINIAKDEFCGGCGYRFNGSKDTIGTSSHSYSGNVNYSGYKDYSGKVPYSGTKDYSGNTSVKCQDDHHPCKCDEMADLIVSFRDTLKNDEAYKKENKANVSKIYDEINGIDINLDKSEKESQEALILFENDKVSLREQSKRLSSAFGMFSQIVHDREKHNAQVVDLVMQSEDEHKQTSVGLKSELKDTKEDYKKKVDKVENLIEEKVEKEKEKGQIEKKYILEKNTIEKDFLSQSKDFEKEDALFDSGLRSLLRTVLPKLQDVTKEDKLQFISWIKDSNMKSTDLMKNVTNFVSEKFM